MITEPNDSNTDATENRQLAYPDRIGLIDKFIKTLHENDITYCHWKSNENLAESLIGKTDLDLLVDDGDSRTLQLILNKLEFTRLETKFVTEFPSMEHYVGFDKESGQLVHLHLHYQLTLGKKNLKDIHLPWGEYILETRILHNRHEIYVTDPNVEMVLLIVRYAIKLNKRDYVRAIVRQPVIDDDVWAEHEYLKERIAEAELRETIVDLIGEEAVPIIESIAVDGFSVRKLWKLKRHLSGQLTRYRRHGRIIRNVVKYVREWARRLGWEYTKRTNRPLAFKYIRPEGGLLIAFIGPDGSGKSTQLAAARSTFDQYSTYSDHLGDRFRTDWLEYPIASLVKFPFVVCWKGYQLAERVASRWSYDSPDQDNPKANRISSPSGESGWKKLVRPIWYGTWALIISFEKRRKLRRVWRARNRGMIVFTDRYPQAQLSGISDGPQLTHLQDYNSRVLRWLAEWEAQPYEWADRNSPDVVLRMNVSPEVAEKRDSDHSQRGIKNLLAALGNIEFEGDEIIINADGTIEDVQQTVCAKIWKQITR